MAWQLFNWIWISPKEKKELSNDELLFVKLHEQWHKKNWYKIVTKKQEQLATRHAFQEMLRQGYKFKDIMRMELSYRLWVKYDLKLNEFVRYMK
ncbi:hypothetical protein ACFLZ6_00130 [Nanoarchaeota archaeon]